MAAAGTAAAAAAGRAAAAVAAARQGDFGFDHKTHMGHADGHRADLLGQFLIDAERQAVVLGRFRRPRRRVRRGRGPSRGPLQPPGARYTRMGVFSLPSKYASSSLRASSGKRGIIRSSNAASSVAFSLSIKAFCGCFRDFVKIVRFRLNALWAGRPFSRTRGLLQAPRCDGLSGDNIVAGRSLSSLLCPAGAAPWGRPRVFHGQIRIFSLYRE